MKRILAPCILLFVLQAPHAEGQQDIIDRQIQNSFGNASDTKTASVVLKKYIISLRPENARPVEWILFDDEFRAHPRSNYALILLVHILRTADWKPGETMPMALALAYNYNYSQGNDEVRSRLLADMSEHFKLYRSINKWQEKKMPYAMLESLPVIPQTYWATRDRSVYETFRIDDYDTRLLSLKDLARLHALVSRDEMLGGTTVFEWANSINKWYRPQRLPKELLTKEIDSYAFGPIMKFQREDGRFPSSSCVADASNLIALYQSVGLAPLTYYQNFRTAGTTKGINHEWPAVYNPANKTWITAQTGNPWPSFNERDVPVDFEIFRPLWHHAWIEQGKRESDKWHEADKAPNAHIGGTFRRNSYGERTTNGLMRDFVFKGIDEKTMERFWVYPVWKRSTNGYLTNGK